ncbi:MAG: hypothetical protein H0Z34_13300 [Brevibacillus sp.]|nr:hypothetical protein [Brevibacillus sp.]
MHVVEKRLLDLVGILLQRPLTLQEARDLKESYQYLVEREWKKGLLEMQSFMAYQTDDAEWQHEICRQIDALDGR